MIALSISSLNVKRASVTLLEEKPTSTANLIYGTVPTSHHSDTLAICWSKNLISSLEK